MWKVDWSQFTCDMVTDIQHSSTHSIGRVPLKLGCVEGQQAPIPEDSTALQLKFPRPQEVQQKFGIVLLSENARIDIKSSAK